MKRLKSTLLIAGMLLFTVTIQAQERKFPKLIGPYLGQKPPEMTPEIFAPGIISKGYFERGVVFSPDHEELFFQLRCLGFTTVLIHMKQKNGTWSQPETACFSGIPEYSDAYAFFTYDGRRLFISSLRPLPGRKEIKKDSDIWLIQKNKEEWAVPIHGGEILNSMFDDDYPTLSKLNNLYFSSNRGGNYDIYVSHFSEEGFSEPLKLDASINTQHFEGHPFVAADDSYLIFSSDRPGELGQGDLYISFKGKENEWLTAINMGHRVNTPFHEVAPYVSPEGKYLFFSSFRPNPRPTGGKKLALQEIQEILDGPGNGRGDIYWVSAKIIENLKPVELR